MAGEQLGDVFVDVCDD